MIGKLKACAIVCGTSMRGCHLDPAFFYQSGDRQMFDMALYYLTALMILLSNFANCIIQSQLRYGEKMVEETPTYVSGVIDFASRSVAIITTGYDV